jgi:hypothetical protein
MDDLVKRLREYCDGNNDLMDAAADRIEALEIETMRLKRSVTKYHRQSLKDAAVLEDMRQALRRNMIHNAQEARAALGGANDATT